MAYHTLGLWICWSLGLWELCLVSCTPAARVSQVDPLSWRQLRRLNQRINQVLIDPSGLCPKWHIRFQRCATCSVCPCSPCITKQTTAGNFPVGLVLLWGLKEGDFLSPKRGSKNRSKRRPPKSQTKRKITNNRNYSKCQVMCMAKTKRFISKD